MASPLKVVWKIAILMLMQSGTPPSPVEFVPGVISTGKEFTVTFSPDANEVYFTRLDPKARHNHIYHSRRTNGEWESAKPVIFSSDAWSDLDPALSPDGNLLFFVSTRPAPGKPSTPPDMDIWYASRRGTEWEQPEYIPEINSSAKEGAPSIDRLGNLYFFSEREGAGHNAIYVSRLVNGKYGPPERLPAEINAGSSDTSPFVTPDGNTLLFYSTRDGGYGKADIYLSKRIDGKWSKAINFGPPVNTSEFEYNPELSPDGKALFFGRNGRIFFLPFVPPAIGEENRSPH